MKLAPIALFVYNRPHHTKTVVEALLGNDLAAESELFVFADGPRNPEASEAVNEVRRYIRGITGFRSVTVIERDVNLGCAQSIVSGVTEIVNRFGQVIVVEDDILTSPYFLKYMNEGLDCYRHNERVACIHGYIYPVKARLPETFFIRGADIWGWATWKRGWDLYEHDCEKLLNELYAKKLSYKLLKNQIEGKLDTWDIRWYAATFLQDKLTLYPGRSLVRNIGIDGSGTHCGTNALFDTALSREPVLVKKIRIKENARCRKAFKHYFKPPDETFVDRVIDKIKTKLHRLGIEN